MIICQCGNEATYHCTACSPPAKLCLNCIGIHLAQNYQDCIKPITSKQTSSNICENCCSEKAVKLGIFEDYSKKLCRVCKNTADFYIDLKWAGFVEKSSDLELLSHRRTVLSRLLKDLENTQGVSQISASLETLKSDMNKLIEKHYLEKLKELFSQTSGSDFSVLQIKKEVTEQCFQKELDLSSEGGRILNSYLAKGSCDLSYLLPQVEIPDLQVFEQHIKSYLDSVCLIEKNKQEKCVFLFVPGKSILFKIKIDNFKKTEFLFDKTWNFEASWCLLDNGEIFICGGNGRDNSEVMLVRTIPESITQLKGFSGRSGHSVIQVGRSVFVFGGNKGSFTEQYLIDEDRWVILSALPQKVQRASSCKVREGVVITGSDTDKLFLYNIEENTYSQIDFPLNGYTLRNKIVFVNEEILYCLTGDKIVVFDWKKRSLVKEHPINDRDWWSYSSPVVHAGVAYFIKYFVRNLWAVTLDTLKLIETPIASMN